MTVTLMTHLHVNTIVHQIISFNYHFQSSCKPVLGSKLNCFQNCDLATPNNESDQQKQNSGCQHYQNTKLRQHRFSLDKTVWLALVFGNSPTSQHCKTKTFFLFTEYIITFQWVSKTFCLFKHNRRKLSKQNKPRTGAPSMISYFAIVSFSL